MGNNLVGLRHDVIFLADEEPIDKVLAFAEGPDDRGTCNGFLDVSSERGS